MSLKEEKVYNLRPRDLSHSTWSVWLPAPGNLVTSDTQGRSSGIIISIQRNVDQEPTALVLWSIPPDDIDRVCNMLAKQANDEMDSNIMHDLMAPNGLK